MRMRTARNSRGHVGWYAAILCIFLTGSAFAQPVSRQTIPMTLSRNGPLVMYFVEGEINGAGPFQLAVDQSVDTLQISQDLADRLGLDRGAEILSVALAVAGVSLGHVPAEIFDPQETYYAGDPPDAILGFSALDGWVVTLDIPAEQFHIEKGTLADAGNAVAYERSEDGYPLLPVQVDDLHALAQISLYSASTLSLPVDIADQLGVTSERRKIGRLSIGGRAGDILGASYEGTLKIGSFETVLTSVRVSEVFEYANVGYNVFQETPVSFDPANNLLLIGERVAVTSLEERAARIPRLDPDAPDLQTAFNAGSGDVQLILILAPT